MTQDNFPEIFKKDLKLYIERAYHIPNIINPEWSTYTHYLIKLLDFKNKEKYLYNSWLIKERKLDYHMLLTAIFYARRNWTIFLYFKYSYLW